MRRKIAVLVTLAATLVANVAIAQSAVASDSEKLSEAQYAARLQSISQTVEALPRDPSSAGELLVNTPEQFSVSTAKGDVKVSNTWLRDSLAEISDSEGEKQAALVAALVENARRRAAAAEAALQPDPKAQQADAAAADILSGREFRHVNKPQLWQEIIERIIRWIERMIDALAARTGAAPWLGRAVVWAIIAAACCFFAVWLFRRFREQASLEVQRTPVPFAGGRKSSRKWLTEAEEAARQGDFREAVHCAYWAAVMRLEESGAWRVDRARTPREYLALLRPGNAFSALQQITRRFELTWYGKDAAGESDYTFIVEQMRSLPVR